MIVNPSAMPSDAMSQQEVRALNAKFDAGRVTAAPTGQVLQVPKRAGGPTAAQAQALSGALDAAGKLHAQAFGSSTIRGLIEELAKCQQALAGFLPQGDPAEIAPAAAPSEALASPLEGGAQGEQVADSQAQRPIAYDAPHAVTELVASAYKATRDALDVLERQRQDVDHQIQQQRERLEELLEYFGGKERADHYAHTWTEPRQ